MRVIIIFYLLLSFIFTFVQGVTGEVIGADFDSLEQMRNTTTGRASAGAITDETGGTSETGVGWLGNIIGLTADFFKNITTMTTFNFKLNGAPKIINDFMAGILGIISLIFWSLVIREIAPLISGLRP